MTAIAATWSRRAAADVGALDAVVDAMSHRGSVRTVEAFDATALASRSRDGGTLARDGGVSAVVDGRIDNRNALAAAGLFDTAERISEAELVLRAYRRWGTDCPRRLLGEFAFVVWDAERRQLTCARDPLGMRPLYYAESSGAFWCASEAHALFEGPSLERRPDPLAIALFLAQHGEVERTFYQHIQALPPAHVLKLMPERTCLRRYWSPDPWRRLPRGDDEEYARLFATTFSEAVGCRIRHDEPVGVELSGGMDSSSVAAQVATLTSGGPRPRALHLSFRRHECDETAFSDAAAAHLQLPCLNVDVDDLEDGRALRMTHPDLIYHPTLTPYVTLFEKAREQGVRTVLTGLGGDQWLDETGTECADALRAGDLETVAAITGVGRKPWALGGYRRLWSAGIKPLVPLRARLATRRFRPRPLHPFLSGSYNRDVDEQVAASQRLESAQRFPNLGSAVLCNRIEHFSTQIPIAQSNLLGASLGIEVTHPFVDLRVFELMLAMPASQRLRRGVHKHKPLLRRAMHALLPEAVLNRRDAAEFPCYLKEVFLRRHRIEVSAMLENSRLGELGVVDAGALRVAFDTGLDDLFTLRLFGLVISMELWLRHSWS